MKFYCEKSDKVMSEVGTSPAGLSAHEAQKRLASNGPNRLNEGKKRSFILRAFMQLLDPMALVLIGAAVLSSVIALIEKHPPSEAIVIMAVILLNSFLGAFQENKAEKAISALQKMSAATTRVLRDGKEVVVKSEDLVLGDIVLIEAGDIVPADGRIIECHSLKVEEASLTGESVPVEKDSREIDLGGKRDIPLGDRKNMVYMGSTVAYGRGVVVVTDIGMNTEVGKIAGILAQAKEEKTPLQIKLSQLSKILTVLVIGICVVIFGVGLTRGLINKTDGVGTVISGTFMMAVSLAVAAIPEGLASVVTIVLSIGVTKMSKRNAIIRKLTAVETLGCTQIICSDKTGTLTQNKMTVTEYFTHDITQLIMGAAMCNDSSVGEDGTMIGDPTETALIVWAKQYGFKPATDGHKRIGEAPFDSIRKMMSTVHQRKDGTIIQYTKGAPDEIIKKCRYIYKDGKYQELTEKDKQEILSKNKQMASGALRILAVAQRRHDDKPAYKAEYLENDMCFAGLLGMIDPVRPEVKDAIDKCRLAGIRAIMITGDHIDTACAIANQLGILGAGEKAVTGAELSEMSDAEFERVFKTISVYARVQPGDKMRIIDAWKKTGNVTAMTGDGVNDAPAIKSADIGVGMGITGTEVTKNVSDMVLLDDNFNTIVNAVEEGRRIYDNVRKVIRFLLSSNMSEVICIFVASLLGFTILKPAHLLLINMVTDSLPAMAMGMELGDPDIMRQSPRSPKDGIFAGGMAYEILYQGIVVSAITLAAYFIGHYMQCGNFKISEGSADGMTMAFLTLSMTEIFHSFNSAHSGSVFSKRKPNYYLFSTAIASFAIMLAVIYIPFLSKAFDLVHISIEEFGVAMLLSISIIPIVEIVKIFQNRARKRKKTNINLSKNR